MVSNSWTGKSSNLGTTHLDEDVSVQATLTPLGWALVDDGVLLDLLVDCPTDMHWRDDHNPTWGGAWWRQDAAGEWHETGEATPEQVAALNARMRWTLE